MKEKWREKGKKGINGKTKKRERKEQELKKQAKEEITTQKVKKLLGNNGR